MKIFLKYLNLLEFKPIRIDNRRLYCETDYLNYQSTELSKSLFSKSLLFFSKPEFSKSLLLFLVFCKPEFIDKTDNVAIDYLKLYGIYALYKFDRFYRFYRFYPPLPSS